MMLGNPSEILGNEGVVCMIREERLLGAFRELVSIDNPTLRERGVCDHLLRRYAALGIRLQEDGTGAVIGGNAGNLYAFVPGDEALAPVLLSAHTDAVSPACGKRAVFHPDGRITSDGTTVLGADDLAGQCAILEAVTSVLEDGAPHRPFELLFDAAEESYCTGIQRFDFSRLRAKLAYVFDLSGPVGGAAYQAPSILSFRAVFTGRAAHAAFSPEEGRHAIRAAAQAAAQIPCGRVGELTVNVGTIAGGTADNIVPDRCTVTGEVRGFDHPFALQKLGEIEAVMQRAAAAEGCTVEFTSEVFCQAYRVDPAGEAAQLFFRCLRPRRARTPHDRDLRRQRQQPFLPAWPAGARRGPGHEQLPQLPGIHQRGRAHPRSEARRSADQEVTLDEDPAALSDDGIRLRPHLHDERDHFSL